MRSVVSAPKDRSKSGLDEREGVLDSRGGHTMVDLDESSNSSGDEEH